MHYTIFWLGANNKAYWRKGLTLEEMKKFIIKKGWQNLFAAWGPEITADEEKTFLCSPGVFMKYEKEDDK